MSDKKIVLPEDAEAASIQTVTGWVSRTGRFWGNDERMARYDGSTHRRCECGELVEQRSYCRACHDRKEVERFEAMPRQEWDGKAMIYSLTTDNYYSSPADAEDDLDEGETLEALQLIICKPNYARKLSEDHFSDDLPKEGDVPDVLHEAMEAFNKALEGVILSWSPGKVALLIEHPAESLPTIPRSRSIWSASSDGEGE